MKLATFHLRNQPRETTRVGALAEDGRAIIDLKQVADVHAPYLSAHFGCMLDVLQAGSRGIDNAVKLMEHAHASGTSEFVHSIGGVRLLAPLPRPESIRDCMTFEQHLVQSMRTVAKWRFAPLASVDRHVARLFGKGLIRVPQVWHERPVYYKGNTRSVIGTDEDVVWPAYTKRLDFELEFGIFIGRRGSNISESFAAEYIAGFSLFNDFSARDIQLREMQGRLGPAKGKDFDTGNAIGPYLVTPDEVADPYRLSMQVAVNDETWTSTSTADMKFSFAEIIAYISRDETLYPGDFIGAGTLPGGCGLELDRWIRPGDVVELRSAELGVLRNRVVDRAIDRG